MEEERCLTPTVHRTISPKSPSRSITGSPVDDKKAVLGSVDRGSPEPNCAICLGKLRNKSFTNSCLHQYCFTCLLEWSKVKAECPLCKQGFQSIIHNVRSIEDYDQYDLLPSEPSYPRPFEVPYGEWEEPMRFRYSLRFLGMGEHSTRDSVRSSVQRTTMTGSNTRFPMASHPVALQPLPPVRRPQQAPWTRARRQIATAEFRQSIYDRNLWVMPLQDITGRYRECSPLFYRNNPAQLHRLYPWLSRELGVLVDNQNRLALVLEAFISMLQYHPINSRTVRNFLRRQIGDQHVDHFIHEFYTFARSPYDMIGFDETAEYGSYEGHTIEIAPSPPRSEADDDADVVVISSDDDDEDIEVNVEDSDDTSSSINNRSRRYMSTGTQAADSAANERRQATHDLSDSDDCVVVNILKPLSQRTPEIIELDSDDDLIEETESSAEMRERAETQMSKAAPNSMHTLDVEAPGPSTSGFQHEIIDSTFDSPRNIPVSEKKPRTRQHKKKKTHSSKSKARPSKKSTKVKHSRSSSSSDFSPKYKSRTRRLSDSSDSLDHSPVRQHRASRNRSRKIDYSSDSSYGFSPIRHVKSRSRNLSKLSYSSDSSSRSPEKRRPYRETEGTRYSGRSSVEDYSYPLSTRIPVYNTIYTSDNDSDYHAEQKPKLRSIVIPKNSHTSRGKAVPYPSTSSSSSSSVRHHEISSNSWSPVIHSHKPKHKQWRHDRKKRRRKATYSSSSSEDFTRYQKKKSSKTVIYTDSD